MGFDTIEINLVQGWLLVGEWTNEEQGKSGGKSSAASLYRTECIQTEGTVE